MPRHCQAAIGILTLLVAPSLLLAQEPVPQRPQVNPAFVNAVGRSTIRIAPNRATLVLVVQSNAATPGEAAETVTRIERAVIDTLTKLGLPRGAVSSTSYGVAPARTQQGIATPGSLFSGRSAIAISITQLDRMPAITAAALARGAALIGQPRFESTAEDSVRAVAFREAVADAQKQAVILAEGMRGRLGRLRDVNADEPTRYDQAQQSYFPVDSPYDTQTRPLPEITISVIVRGRWELVIPPS
jgi:uncharacterized protein YggE